MRKLINILIIVLLVTILGNTYVYAEDFDNLKILLLETGVDEPYNNTIINYLKSSVIGKEDLAESINLTRVSINTISEKGGITKLTFGECGCIYNNIRTICNYLNFKIHISFITFKFSIIDKLSGGIIFQGDLRNLNEYSIIFETLMANNEFVTELIT